MLRFLRLLRLAVWRAFQHDAFAIAKASAYSSILTFFPTLLVAGIAAGDLPPTPKSICARSPTPSAAFCRPGAARPWLT